MELTITEKSVQSDKKIVSVQIPLEVYSSLKKEAEEDFISISDVIRRVIIKYYRSKNTTM